MTEDEIKALISKMSMTPPRDKQRIDSIWNPYIDAEKDRVNTELETSGSDELVFSVLGGASASMKSTWRKRAEAGYNPKTPQEQLIIDNLLKVSVIADPDDAKLMIPEYQAHLEHQIPGGASFVHQESRNITEAMRKMAEDNQLPITYDTSGQFNDGYQTLIDMKNAGYKTKAMYFLAPNDVLAARVAEREKETGRSVPGYVIRNIASNLVGIIPDLWRGGYLDELVLVDTTDPDDPKILHMLSLAEDLLFEADEDALKGYFGPRNDWWLIVPQKANY
jgi:predicted kinase